MSSRAGRTCALACLGMSMACVAARREPEDAGAGDGPATATDAWECTTEPDYLDGSIEMLPLTGAQDSGPIPSDLPPSTGYDHLVFHGVGQAEGILRSSTDTFAFTLETVANWNTGGSTDEYVVLDDTVVRPFVDGVQQDHLTHTFVGRVSSLDFEIRGVPAGLHSLTLVRSVRDPSVPAGTAYRGDVLTPTAIFGVTLVRDHAVWADLAEVDGVVGAVPPEFWLRDVRVDSPTLPLHGGPDSTGMVALRLSICTVPETPSACASLGVWSGFILFLDGVPFRVSASDVVTARVTPSECRFVTMSVASLPLDGAPHRLDVVHLAGLQSPIVLELGGPLRPYGSGAYTSVGIAW